MVWITFIHAIDKDEAQPLAKRLVEEECHNEANIVKFIQDNL